MSKTPFVNTFLGVHFLVPIPSYSICRWSDPDFAYSRPCQAGFAGVWFRHEKPLRFRAIPPEPLQHGVEQKATKGTKKEFSALWSLFLNCSSRGNEAQISLATAFG